MRNSKHTLVGLLTLTIIGTMSAKQLNDFIESNRLAALLSNNAEITTSVSPEIIRIDPATAARRLSETYTEEELRNIESKKSSLQDSYVLLTEGTLSVYNAPSEDGAIIDALNKCETVKIAESTDGWYKIVYGSGKAGYVDKEHITDSKAEADYAAMHYDNYKRGKVKTSGSDVNIRSSASSKSNIIGQLENRSDIVLLYDDNGYTKVCFGADMATGFIVSECIELTDTWISKSEVISVQQAVVERKAAEAKAKAEADSRTKATSKKSTYTTPASSSNGQSILNQAKKYLGVKYVYGGTTPKGFDCSGLVQYVCKSLGIKVNRTAAAQFSNGKAVNKKDLQPGDLLFFAKNGRIHHVGIYAGNGQMIHAPQTGDVVKYSSINTAYRQREYVGARRVY